MSWPNVAVGDEKTPFSIAAIARSRGGCYFFPLIAPLTLDLYLTLLSAKQGGIMYLFWYDLTWD